MKRFLFALLIALMASPAIAGSILIEGFEYGNHDMERPIGWSCDDNAWLSGYLEKDHNRMPHTGNWYAFSNSDDAWMFMQLYFINSVQYRINCWAISDGICQLELWAGTSPAAADMHTLLLCDTIDSDTYEKVSTYVESIPEGYEYIGIRAITNGNATHLTIDDIKIDMVEQYDFVAEPITGDSSMYPGSQGNFRFMVQNIGYDALDIIVRPTEEFFTDFSCQFNDYMGSSFSTQPNEKVMVTITATLRPEIEPGSICWLDVLITIPCNCNTAMVTFWVTPLELEQTAENISPEIKVFPNPAINYVTIEGEDAQKITLYDLTGRMVMSVTAEAKQTILNLGGLKSGIYVVEVEGKKGVIRRSLVKE